MMKQKLRFIGTAFIAFFIVVSIFLNQTKVNAEDTNEICIPDLIQQAIGDESEAPYTCVEGDYFLKLYSNGYLIISPNESERYAEDYSNDSEIHDMFTTSVTNVIIDDGITRIHDYFFCDYMNTIHNIIMSDTVTEIGEGAFSNCSAENVRLSNNLETIADYAFNSACIINMPLPNSVTSIGNYAFMYYGYNRCANPVIIPDSVLELGEGIFYGSGVSIVELPDNLTYIPNYTFSYCEWLTEVNIPTSALWIGEQAFSDCYQLHTLDIPESVSSIGALSFMLCSGLESVNLPSYLDSIPYGAFEYCTSLREIRMPETMDGAIDDVAFEGCYSLTSITVPEGTTEIGDQAFLYVPLDTIQFSDSVRKIGERAFVYTNLQGTLDLNQVEEIEQWAFVDLPSIDQIYAYNVTTIENDVFKLYNSEAIPTAIYTTPGGMLENPLYWETQNRIMSNLFAEPLTRPTEMYITRHVIGDAVNIQSIMDRGSDDVTKCYGEFSGDHARPSDAYDLASHTYTEVYFEHEICNLDNSLVPDITIAEISQVACRNVEAAEVYLLGVKVRDENGDIVEYGATDNGIGYYVGCLYNSYGMNRVPRYEMEADNEAVVAGRDYSMISNYQDGTKLFSFIMLPDNIVSVEGIRFIDVSDRYACYNSSSEEPDGFDLDAVKAYYLP